MAAETVFRAATLDDVPKIAKHRRLMYEDMRASGAFHYEDEDLDKMETEYENYLRRRIADGSLVAWMAEFRGSIVGSGCVSILAWPPAPSWSAAVVGLLHSMYTVPEFRKQGIAGSIIKALADACKTKGCRRLIMGGPGTDTGRHLYETLGFRPSENMGLNL